MRTPMQWLTVVVALLLCVSCATPTGSSSTAPPSASSPAPPSASSGVEQPSAPPSSDSLSPPPSVRVKDTAAASHALGATIEAIAAQYHVTGLSLAVFDSEGVWYRQACGYAVLEPQQPATTQTLFRVASISKAVTALLMLDLAEQGKLQLDADLSDYVGLTLRNPNYPELTVTARQLLTHTAGFIDSGVYEQAVARNSLPQLSTVLPSCYASYPPGGGYYYSNFGMGLAAGVVEGAAGQRFLEYSRERLFAPMAADAAYSYTDIADKQLVANLYKDGELSADPRQWRTMNAKYIYLPLGQLYGLGQGDLIITADNLARIASVMAGNTVPDMPLTPTATTIQLMNTVQYELLDAPDAPATEIRRGLGTQITDNLLDDRRMVGHQGNAYGSISGMFWDPELRCGFVLLTNGADGGKTKAGVYLLNRAVAQAVFGTLYDYTPQSSK